MSQVMYLIMYDNLCQDNREKSQFLQEQRGKWWYRVYTDRQTCTRLGPMSRRDHCCWLGSTWQHSKVRRRHTQGPRKVGLGVETVFSCEGCKERDDTKLPGAYPAGQGTSPGQKSKCQLQELGKPCQCLTHIDGGLTTNHFQKWEAAHCTILSFISASSLQSHPAHQNWV